MKNGLKGFLLATAMVSGTASADLNYTYIEGGAAILSGDASQTYIGFDTRGSYLINDNIFAYGGFRMLSDDLDYTNWYLGAGYRHALDAKTDVWVGGNLEYQELENKVCNRFFGCASASVDDTAPAARGGIRHQLNEKIEVGASARYVLGDADYIGLNGQGRYSIQENLSITGEVDLQDGNFGLFGGVTYFF